MGLKRSVSLHIMGGVLDNLQKNWSLLEFTGVGIKRELQIPSQERVL